MDFVPERKEAKNDETDYLVSDFSRQTQLSGILLLSHCWTAHA